MNCIINSSDFGSQKCSLPIEEFSKLECHAGCAVKVTTCEGTFMCKLYPSRDLKNDSVIDNTVEVFRQCHKFFIADPLLGSNNIVKLGVPTTATNLTVTIVVKNFKNFRNLEKCKISFLVKNLLSNKVLTKCSSLRVGKFCCNAGIEKILVLHSQPVCEALIINSKTQVKIERIVTSSWIELQGKVQHTNLGGLKQAYSKLKELVVYPLQYPHIFTCLHVPRGILLYGPPGCGKSSIIGQLCAEYGLYLISVSCSDLSSSDPGGSEEKLKSFFDESQSVSSPTVLFLDGVDSICPKRGWQSHTNRLIVCLADLMDKINYDNHHLTIMAATNRLEDVDPSLRRPGRLDREIHLNVPNRSQRQEIVTAICKDMLVHCNNDDIELVSGLTVGYVGADLSLLCREALHISQNRDQPNPQSPTIQFENDWKVAIGRVRPSIMRCGTSGNSEFRRVNWDDVGGLEEAKMYIRRSVEWPLKYPKAFKRLNVPRPKGVLIYGPPGCGKSLLVRAAATSCAASFFSISAAELFSPFVGDSEKMVSDLFRRAREASPAILFLDELDAMVGGRSSSNLGRSAHVVATLLQEMDGISSGQGVIVVGATNRPDKIDDALLRPGRFDSLVHIPHPNQAARLAILHSLCRKMPLKGVDLDEISRITKLFSGADLESLTKEAALGALERDISAVCIMQKHFTEAFTKVVPSFASQDLIKFYDYYARGQKKNNK